MYLAIITLPLLSAISAGLLGRKIGVTGAQLITSGSVITTCFLALIAFYEVGLTISPVSIKLFSWIDSESLTIDWGFNFDALTVSMLIPVLIVSALVHVYSIGYMSEDPHQQRFFSYLSMFTFFMLILVTGDNYLVMFIGWEGVGISSYLLVSFWFTRVQANKSAISALLFNRVGDMFLTIGLFALIFALGNIDYAIVFSIAPYLNENTVTIIGICFLIGAMAKSAQIGLHVWLPQAMEGPTPVSALIHAATMVTAGVYLLMRSSPLLEYSPTVLLLALWIGAITTLFAGTIGLFQNDLKKVIAYSTCSQLGMLFIAVGLSQYNVALFHLVNHAFFKALLFLGAGSIIHAMADEQDMRRLGGLVKLLPFSYAMMLIGSLSLAAMPFLTGFYSKDLIIELAFGQFEFSGQVVYWLAVISAIFTMTYSIRLLFLTFLSAPNGAKINYEHSHEGPLTMAIPLIILAIMSIIFGYYARDFFVGLGSSSLAHSLFVHPDHIISVEAEFAVPTVFKLLPVVASVLVGLTVLTIYQLAPSLLVSITKTKIGASIYAFFNQRYWLELIVNKFIVVKGLSLGYVFNKQLDRGAIELIGPHGVVSGLSSVSGLISRLDTGIITNYALYILLGLISFISLVFFAPIDPQGESIKAAQYSQLFILYIFALTAF
uniref:NADH-ubiquinone oxidoreductase chain 5 n=1 Tax=Taphrina flavorubra JCM 22207 TaxID=1450759 RepID=A0A2Z5RDA0_9ASCO|nr:NADH dehydrogenase subunit 5 [Taphrina flavorubra JCM 22207]